MALMMTIKTGDDVTIMVDKALTNMIGLFKIILQDSSLDDPIVLSNITASALAKILEYCKHHEYTNPPPIRKPVPSHDLASCVADKFDIEFISSYTFDQLFDLVNICEFLDLVALKDLAFAKIAAEFKGTPIEDLKTKFGLSSDLFNKEDRDSLLKENEWVAKQLFGD